jgi:hypothetical protein
MPTEKKREYNRQYYLEHAEHICQKAAAWQRENKDSLNNTRRGYMRAVMTARRLRQYGITPQQVQDLLASQNYQCAICGHSDTTNPRVFPVIDHCHTKSHVRGLLCCNCNQAIGKMKDDPKLLRKAAKYLENFNRAARRVNPAKEKPNGPTDSDSIVR